MKISLLVMSHGVCFCLKDAAAARLIKRILDAESDKQLADPIVHTFNTGVHRGIAERGALHIYDQNVCVISMYLICAQGDDRTVTDCNGILIDRRIGKLLRSPICLPFWQTAGGLKLFLCGLVDAYRDPLSVGCPDHKRIKAVSHDGSAPFKTVLSVYRKSRE